MNYADLPEAIRTALEQIVAGAKAADFESETLDFKEDPAVHPQVRNPDGDLIATLRDTAICLVNGEGGAAANTHIVLGVADKVPGAAAITGTERDLDWLERKIMQGTAPPLRVEAAEFMYLERRLVWIRIPKGLDFYQRPKGDATYRLGSQCMPAGDEVRRAIRFARLNPDYSAASAAIPFTALNGAALQEARRLLERRYSVLGKRESVPSTDLALLRDLGLLTKNDEVTVAAALLFAPVKPPQVRARYFYRVVPGAEPAVTEISEPLIFAIPRVADLVARNSSQELARIDLGGGQEVAIPAFPQQAVDEVVVNAFAHRDWAMLAPISVEQTPGTLSVVSPGALPTGVHKDKLLTTHSVPRNPTLMGALRALGLAEESSRGFDRMFAAMLSTGRGMPEIEATEMYVKVVLAAGKPDGAFVRGVNDLAQRVAHEVVFSVSTLIVLNHLYHKPLITLNEVVARTETSMAEARELMELLTNYDLLHAVGRKLEQWVLSRRSLAAFGDRAAHGRVHQPVEEWIREQLAQGNSLTARAVAEASGISRQEVTALLRRMRSDGEVRIDPNGPERGANARWIRA